MTRSQINRDIEHNKGTAVGVTSKKDEYRELRQMTDRLCRLMQWEPDTAHKFEIVRQTCSGRAAALSIEKGNQIADKLTQLMKDVCDYELAAIGDSFVDGMEAGMTPASEPRVYRLPVPPLLSQYLIVTTRGGKPRQVLTAKGVEFRHAVFQIVNGNGQQQEPMDGRLAVEITVYPKTSHRSDLDNRLKACLDSLVYSNVIVDDSQIDDLRIRRGEKRPPDGECVVTVREL